ncbi:MAG: putative L,D-transpeptidase ErfK/SrfK [Alphaproteobacteria bacterium MarineAlpha9_Bin3]|nr:MAG: putative L,D-transpeptidase ErfK/SrfK [Alphaproteobacteria bacterium MarineAlpha9_Bin3]
MDPWIPGKDKKLLIPKSHIVPLSKRDGIVINIGDLRLYYFEEGELIDTFPIGIGRSGWETPLGKAKVIKKKQNPIWIPPESVRKEDPSLPKVVAAGDDNPLGNRAIYLSMPSYLIHGTNKPYGVGMKVSHGCIRLYPEDIETLYDLVVEGTNVNIINQSIKAGWKDSQLYLEVHILPDYVTSSDEKQVINSSDLYPQAYEVIQRAAGLDITKVDWDKVKEAVKKANGIPINITISE